MFKYPWCPNIHDVLISVMSEYPWCPNIRDVRISVMSEYPWYPNIHDVQISMTSDTWYPWKQKKCIFREVYFTGKSIFPGSQISPRMSTMSIYPQFMILNWDWWDKWCSTRTDARTESEDVHDVHISAIYDTQLRLMRQVMKYADGRTDREWNASVDLTASLPVKIAYVLDIFKYIWFLPKFSLTTFPPSDWGLGPYWLCHRWIGFHHHCHYSGDTGKPCGIDYELKAFVGETAEDKPHKRNSVRLAIRKVMYAPSKPGDQPSVEVSKEFIMSPSKLHLECSLDKEVSSDWNLIETPIKIYKL